VNSYQLTQFFVWCWFKLAAEREYNRKWAENWKKNNPEAHLKKVRAYNKANKEKKNAAYKRWYYEHAEEQKFRSREWARKNRKSLGEKERFKVQTDLSFRIKKRLRSRVKSAIQGKGLHKHFRTMEMLGGTYEQLHNHIELKFQPGMTWENYGRNGWHIDHIRPCASFDLSDPAQQKECFHYTNLQPLWAKDNLSKGAKWQIV
jgi:hypothetical protein